MNRDRIIAEVETAADAKKVEETVKTGYAEAMIETIVNWIGVEEDLASSYENLAMKHPAALDTGVYQRLAKESRDNVRSLVELKKSLEKLDEARVPRIEQLSRMK